MAIPVYRGRFGEAQAERLLWRAGFGPRPGQAKALAKKGLKKAVLSLTRPAPEKLVGPAPTDDRKVPIAPLDSTGHDHLWWLDRMVRGNRPLVERLTLVWHDWFATSNAMGVRSQKLMLEQNALLRQHALGSFSQLLLDITKDPAMLLFLSGNRNTKTSPNENYARELMELFTLGADRGYDESDVREQARSLTGWRSRYARGVGDYDFHYEPRLHDDGVKRIFGKQGNFDWQDSCRLCLEHPLHSSFLVRKLWSYFIPTVPGGSTQEALEKLYRSSRYQVRPLVEAILQHPDLYLGPRMVKPPVVYTAGLLRAMGRGVDSAAWFRLSGAAGQRLFYPPNVAGWEDDRWLDTATFRGRWNLAAWALRPVALDEKTATAPANATGLLTRALAFWSKPPLRPGTRQALLAFAQASLNDAKGSAANERAYPVLIENALRQLIAVSPDLQTS